MSTPALPPHTPLATEANGFDVDADVAALKAAPKQEFQQQEPEPTNDPPPNPDPKPGDGPDAPPAGEGGGPAGPDAKASAKEFIEAYDMLQCWSFSMFSKGMKPEEFALPAFAKDRAAHHLAKGLEKMGNPELPWWVGLLIALAPPAGINFMSAKAHREAMEAREQQAQHRPPPGPGAGPRPHSYRPPPPPPPPAPFEPVPPTSITRPDGSEVPMQPTIRVVKPADTSMPLCQECGINHVRNRRKKYCSQQCAGKATARINQQRAQQRTA